MTEKNLKQVKGSLRHLPYSCDTRVKFFEQGPPIPQVDGVIYSNIYRRMTNITFIARMSLTGVGCRLQTCSRLASERFNSAFCAPIFTWEQTLQKQTKHLHTHINYATCTGNRMCFFYEALYLLFFSIYFLSIPFSFRTTPSIASTFHRLDGSLLNLNQPFSVFVVNLVQ